MLARASRPLVSFSAYELVGIAVSGRFYYVLSGSTPPPAPSPVPVAQLVRHLYKTIDGGATWQEILSSVPYGSSLQLASAHPNLLYVGGLTGMGNTTSPLTFHMQYSADGGVTQRRLLEHLIHLFWRIRRISAFLDEQKDAARVALITRSAHYPLPALAGFVVLPGRAAVLLVQVPLMLVPMHSYLPVGQPPELGQAKRP